MDDRTSDASKFTPSESFHHHQQLGRWLDFRSESTVVEVKRLQSDDATAPDAKFLLLIDTKHHSRPDASGQTADRQRIVDEFSAFYRTHAAKLAGWLIWQGASEADAKDVIQETMHKAYRLWDTIAKPEAWARTTASRAYAERVGRHDAVPVVDTTEYSPGVDDSCELAAAATKHDLRMAVRQLPLRQRQVLAWSFEGYTPTEIAQQLGMEPAAVRSSLYKARQRLHELLDGWGEGNR